jgi:hypothetical protein
MSNIVQYTRGGYRRNNYVGNNHRGQGYGGHASLNNQLKMAEIEAGHMLRDELHSATIGF